mmetsp:Transcript_17717/g.37089  ORF Transcript_17717/g.37089 Transcript_17717/m.37089 type:complete len:225 (+) Transcript_17717:82-756(+)
MSKEVHASLRPTFSDFPAGRETGLKFLELGIHVNTLLCRHRGWHRYRCRCQAGRGRPLGWAILPGVGGLTYGHALEINTEEWPNWHLGRAHGVIIWIQEETADDQLVTNHLHHCMDTWMNGIPVLVGGWEVVPFLLVSQVIVSSWTLPGDPQPFVAATAQFPGHQGADQRAFLGWPPSIQDVLHVASRDPAAELRGPLQELQHQLFAQLGSRSRTMLIAPSQPS